MTPDNSPFLAEHPLRQPALGPALDNPSPIFLTLQFAIRHLTTPPGESSQISDLQSEVCFTGRLPVSQNGQGAPATIMGGWGWIQKVGYTGRLPNWELTCYYERWNRRIMGETDLASVDCTNDWPPIPF